MRRFLDTRLARMSKTEAPRELLEARHRSLLRGRAALGALLRKSLVRSDALPALSAVLQLGDAATTAIAKIPDTPELRKTDAALLACDYAGVEEMFEARLSRLVAEFRRGRKLDPANASPAELVAAYAVGTESGEAPGFGVGQFG